MKIAIAGYGLEGESNLRYYLSDPNNDITVVDENQLSVPSSEGVRTLTGKEAMSSLYGYDMIIRTAGLSPSKIKTDGKIWSATNEFFSKCPAQIIGVTGSKGKGTTASLIASILRQAGKKVWLVGNIGKPSLDVVKEIQSDDVVVYELSSFQLWDIEFSPHIAVILYIEREHLDVHASFEEYLQAKANITKFQKGDDLLVYNKDNQYVSNIAEGSCARLVGYPAESSAHVMEGYFYYNEQQICSTNALNIVGNHNLENACAAIDVVWNYVQEPSVIEKGLSDFKGLPHRLQFIKEVDGVEYYDDSIATTPSSTIAALRSFDKPIVVILGGSSKGANFDELAQELRSKDIQALLIGDEAQKIAKACQVADFSRYEIVDNPTMKSVVKLASKKAQKGGIVLLSPACASFGLFKNYADRGEQFVSAVNEL